jgi:hypothetical protein
MPIYLWHMVPAVLLIELGYPRVFGLPAVGTRQWWQQRPIWIAALAITLALVLVVLAVVRQQVRTMRKSKAFSSVECTDQPAVSPPLLTLGVAFAAAGIGMLAVNGFAPHGTLNVIALVAVAIGLTLVVVSGGSRYSLRRDFTSG